MDIYWATVPQHQHKHQQYFSTSHIFIVRQVIIWKQPLLTWFLFIIDKKCNNPELKVSTSRLFTSNFIENYISSLLGWFYLDQKTTLPDIVSKLLNRIDFFPEYASVYTRCSVYFVSFIVADGIWIITAVALLSKIFSFFFHFKALS